MSNIKLVITDLDSTLLNDEKKISDYTYQIITAIREKGIKFVPATARALRVLKRMELTEMIPHDLLVCLNGSKIYNEKDEIIYHKGLMKEELDLFLPKLIESYGDCRISIEMNEKFYVNHNIWEVDPYEKNYEISDLKNLPDLTTERIMLGLTEGKDIEELRKILPDYLYAHRVEGTNLCRVLHKEVSKANAIKYLCELWDIDISEVVVFGDDENDLEMFRLCDHAVAMDNAIDELKEIASDVTRNNNQDGVAYWMEQNIL